VKVGVVAGVDGAEHDITEIPRDELIVHDNPVLFAIQKFGEVCSTEGNSHCPEVIGAFVAQPHAHLEFEQVWV
jgi:hypothetical protein